MAARQGKDTALFGSGPAGGGFSSQALAEERAAIDAPFQAYAINRAELP
jgi:hypothetical protein